MTTASLAKEDAPGNCPVLRAMRTELNVPIVLDILVAVWLLLSQLSTLEAVQAISR